MACPITQDGHKSKLKLERFNGGPGKHEVQLQTTWWSWNGAGKTWLQRLRTGSNGVHCISAHMFLSLRYFC